MSGLFELGTHRSSEVVDEVRGEVIELGEALREYFAGGDGFFVGMIDDAAVIGGLDVADTAAGGEHEEEGQDGAVNLHRLLVWWDLRRWSYRCCSC